MIEETITYACRSCGSKSIIRNGHNKCGNLQYKYKACGTCGVLRPKQKYGAEVKETILEAHTDRMRGLERVFSVAVVEVRNSHITVAYEARRVVALMETETDGILRMSGK